MEVLVRSYCRAHPVSVRHRVLVSKGPLAPDTDRRHRRIRERLVDCRADGCAGRDEKDVGVVRSCSCGVAEKKSAALNGSRGPRSKLTRNPEPDSVWNGAPERAALVQEWYYATVQLSSNNVMLCAGAWLVQTEMRTADGSKSLRNASFQHPGSLLRAASSKLQAAGSLQLRLDRTGRHSWYRQLIVPSRP